MFDFSSESCKPPKCQFAHKLVPAYVDHDNPPSKKFPFSTILSHPFVHTVDFILPEEIYGILEQQLSGNAGSLRYARLHMTLAEILDGDFFNEYIKKGNIVMLSEGRPGIDNTFSLYEGILRLELDRTTYERCGLVGKPIHQNGRKHTKSRFAIEIDLRQPSMLHGKKGFERIVWAANNVLNHSVTWLLHDFIAPDLPENTPIHKHSPIIKDIRPTVTPLSNVNIPALTQCGAISNDVTNASDIYEWLGLISMGSPRIMEGDSIDPYLSRYEVPSLTSSINNNSYKAYEATSGNIVKIRWHGLLTPTFISQLWLLVREAARESWMATNVCCFRGQAYTLLGVGTKDVLLWEFN